ncbi:L,D-transpeptidase family protein [Methylonatrum kenyense]|uniref:L,D-transpeptidase family protein n=1 Tax=Methylonatrum kenyense TaxID=455253 RepID=UPI0020BF060A|nr:L,D-transpeptidase family protein [Methylonatrum kenyense]MCK8515540.1 L,D-transpeptidase family protein [Methylonatrum kenyense]
MFTTVCRCLPLVLLLAALPLSAADLREALRDRLESIPPDQPLMAGEHQVPGPGAVRRFYQERLFEPLWIDAGGRVERAAELLEVLVEAESHGLDRDDYGNGLLEALIDELQAADGNLPARVQVDLELLLSGTWMQYGSHALMGRLNPQTIDPEWGIDRRGGDLPELLQAAADEARLADGLRELFPGDPGYQRLREALGFHRQVQQRGGFTEVPDGPTLRPGDSEEQVALLRQRLQQSGDLSAKPDDQAPPALFDDRLEAAVRGFQQRHGLEVDAVVGPATRRALNVPAHRRVRQISVNLERWRWMPRDLGERYVMVNIAGFDMQVVDQGEKIMHQRVIVGRDYRQTPVFTGRMTYLVLNPYWEVPNSIAVRDILPQVRRDPSHLQRLGFQVLRGWGAEQQLLDPETIDWATVPSRGFPYRLRQKPGPQNALGRIKFMFPNRHAVYLHDTPARELFRRADRAFSSGCIRVEEPEALAELLLDDPRWSRERIAEAIGSGREQTVILQRPVPVHLQYMTAWVDADGLVHLRNDLYNRDSRVADALSTLPEGTSGGS